MREAGVYFGLLTPDDDGRPEMFFRTEAWARAALAELLADNPAAVGVVRLVRVNVRIAGLEEIG